MHITEPPICCDLSCFAVDRPTERSTKTRTHMSVLVHIEEVQCSLNPFGVDDEFCLNSAVECVS